MFYQGSTLLKSYNFILEIGSTRFFTVKSVTLPNYGLEIKADLLGQGVQHSPGKGQWEPVTIEFYDYKYRDLDGESSYDSMAHRLFETLARAKGKAITGNQNFKINSANILQAGEDKNLPDITIKKIYGNKYVPLTTGGSFRAGPNNYDGAILEAWTLREPILAGIDFGKMDYASEDLNIITMIVQYTNAVHNTFE
tara:strand:+ start:174 stop:761 length:588 start_codon:yes stop_codon:yes gene_type:complete